MKILFDHQIMSLQKYGGISRYFCELMTRFSEDPSVDFSLALRFSFNEHLTGLPRLDRYWSCRSSLCSRPRVCSFVKTATDNEGIRTVLARALYRVNGRESERLLKKQDFDLVHPTYYDPYFLKSRGKKPCVVTVHDMTHEIFPEYFPARDPVRAWKKQVVQEADAIISVSECTKADLVRLFSVDPGKISVIHHGNPFGAETEDRPVKGDGQDTAAAKNPYLLFVGNRSGYKNFDLFLRAVSPILHRNDRLQVWCAGGGPFTPREMELISDLQMGGRVRYMQTNDVLIKNLYRNARAFVYPSLYEGFGLPVLEAFSCGCPVVLSDKSSLPEVGGDAALYFDPADPESLAGAIERLLSDDALRARLIASGYGRRKLFTWEKTAAATKKVYERMADR